MNRFTLFFYLCLALNLIVCTSYAPYLLSAEELTEHNSSLVIEEEELKTEIDFVLKNFKFLSLIFQKESQLYFLSDAAGFSIYEQDILIPPPDFFGKNFS